MLSYPLSYYITILFLLLTLFLTRRIDKCLIHPITLTSSLWLFLLIGYNVIDHGLYPLSDKFYYALMAWIIPFQIACLSMSNKYVRVRRLHLAHSATPLITNRYVILFISICLIISLVMSYQRAIVFDPSNFYSAWSTFNLFLKQRTPIYPIKKRNILPLSAPITINAKTNKKNNRLYLNRSSLNK